MKRSRVPGDHDGQPPRKKPNAGPKVKDAMGYLEQVKTKFANKPQVYNQFLDIMKDFKSQAINTEGVIDRVKTLFKGNRNLILGFNQFLPPGYKIELPIEKKPTIEFNHAVQYVAKIKNRFRDQPEIYGEFLDILHDYQANRTIDEVFARVQKLFGGQPDLLDEFKYFLPTKAPSNRRIKHKSVQKKKIPAVVRRPAPVKEEPPRIRVRVTYPPGSDKDLQLLERIKNTIPRNSWVQLIKTLHLHTLGIVTRLELVTMVEDILSERFPEYVERFKNMINYDEWQESMRVTRERKNYYTFVASVDFTSCQQPTPSYRRIPDDIPLPSCSGRTPLCDTVLNNRCISIPTGSEDFSFKATRKNQYEENLFKCEDERFELDMLIENNASAIRVLEPIQKRIEEMSPQEASHFTLPKSLDILHIRAIARLYGDHGYQIIDLLNKNPTVAIPIVLARLRQKDEEWRRVRVGMRDQWRKIAAQNYNKSLDHRSFYFKQEDKKRVNPKSLINNLKDMHHYTFEGGTTQTTSKNRQPDADVLRQIQAGNKPIFNYCMRFKFDDPTIHSEVYQTIKFALQCHPEYNSDTCLTFWSNFIHHFFNAPSDADIGDWKQVKAETKNITTRGGKELIPQEIKTEALENGTAMEEDNAAADVDEKTVEPVEEKTEEAEAVTHPVRLSLDTWEMDEIVSPIRRHTRKSRLFFGTSNLYVLVRMHEMLYNRLRRAKELAFTHKNKATKAQLDAYSKSNKRRTKEAADKSVTEGAKQEGAMETEAPFDEFLNGNELKAKKTVHPHDQFRSLLRKILSKQMDTTHYEDELRGLLGAKSFVLFTIDRLVTQLLKQLNSCTGSEVCKKLIGLYHSSYKWSNTLPKFPSEPKDDTQAAEHKRSIEKLKMRHSAQTARMYRDMAASTINDDTWIQMEYFEDTNELAIGLLEGHDAQQKPAPKEWQEYSKEFVQDVTVDLKTAPFLGRNLRLCMKKYGEDASFAQASRAALEDMEQYCGLEFQMGTKDYKLQFVDDTEEYLIRRKKHNKAWKENLKTLYDFSKKAFEAWEEERLAELKGGMDEDK